MAIIEVNNVSKHYPARRGAKALLGRGGVGEWFKREKPEAFQALKDISLSVEAGESIGLIGRNGSGKSTLLKLLAGVTLPTAGRVRVEGRIASLLELGAGFHPMLTGRENVYLNAGLLGMGRRDVDREFDKIVAFSGIAEFIDQPVDTYSSGMYVRIAFAVAVHANPDVFLVDEVLAVGDESFQRKCRSKIAELREQGKTIVFVSHDLGLVHALCDRIYLLSGGELIQRKTPQATIEYYLRQIGHDSGIHTLRHEGIEAIFSHGKIALFQQEEERTAPGGITAQVVSMHQAHESGNAQWEIVEKSETHCVAMGEFARIPAKLQWRSELVAEGLQLNLQLEVLRPLNVENASLFVAFPDGFNRFLMGTREAPFPPIVPGQRAVEVIAPDEPGTGFGALEAQEAELLPVHFEVETGSGGGFSFMNSDYMTGSRILQVIARFPQSAQPLTPGNYPIATLTLHLPDSPQKYNAWKQQQRAAEEVISATLAARMYRGRIELRTAAGALLTDALGLHLQCRCGGLWALGPYMDWQAPRWEDGLGLVADGHSSRLPFVLRMAVTADGEALVFRAWLVSEAPVAIDEYNVSLLLPTDFTTWELHGETEQFPAIALGQQDWRHVSKSFDAFQEAAVCRDGNGALMLRQATEGPALLFSALTTGEAQQAHVIQLLRTPGPEGQLQFEAGAHLLAAISLQWQEGQP